MQLNFCRRGGQAKLDARKAILREQGFGLEPVIPDTKIPELTAGTVGAGTTSRETEEEKRLKAIQKQQKAAKDLLRVKRQDAQLLSAGTEKERDLLQLQFDKLDLSKQFPLLKEEELQPLRDQLEINFGLTQADKDRIQAAKELKEQQDAEAARVQKLAQQYQGIADTLANGVVDALKGAVDGTTSLAQAATSLLDDLANGRCCSLLATCCFSATSQEALFLAVGS